MALATAAALLFAWLAHAVAARETMPFDLAVRSALHPLASRPLTLAMRGATDLGSTWFLVVAGGLLVWRLATSGRRRSAWLLFTVVAGAEILDQLLKLTLHRPRPEAFFGLPQPSSYSFPSGHSVASCRFYAAVAVLLARRVHTPLGKAAVWAAAVALVALEASRECIWECTMRRMCWADTWQPSRGWRGCAR